MQDFESPSPLAQAAEDGQLIAGHTFLTYNGDIIAQWGWDRQALLERKRQLLELDGHKTSMALTA